MRYYTADLHLNSPGAIPWFNRQFSNVYKMNEALIKFININCKYRSDVLIHVGDFCAWGNEKGMKCLNISPKVHIEKIIPNIILIEGNHDANNKVKTDIKTMNVDLGIDPDLNQLNVNDPTNIHYVTTDLGKVHRNVSIGHYPSHAPEAKGQFQKHTIRICGHVHKAWKYYWDQENDVLNINVGCDVWRLHPVSEVELIRYIVKLENKLGKHWN